MTITSTPSGTQSGYTVITVSPAKTLSANKYRYKVSASDITLPSLNSDLSTWTLWNGTDEISATNGYYIAVAECDAYNRCDKVGKTTVSSTVVRTITYMLDNEEIIGLEPTTYVEGVGAILPTGEQVNPLISPMQFSHWIPYGSGLSDYVTEITSSDSGDKTFVCIADGE